MPLMHSKRTLIVIFIRVLVINLYHLEEFCKENKTIQYYYIDNIATKCIRWSMVWRQVRQFLIHSNQSILYCGTGFQSGLVTGIGLGLDQHLVLYYWLSPNCKVN